MPETWAKALKAYDYPARLSDYRRATEFPGYFNQDIAGHRDSTIDFENYFRAYSDRLVEPYLEAVFWKLYSQGGRGQRTVDRIVDHVLEERVTAPDLNSAIELFLEGPTRTNLSVLRALLGIKTDVLVVALTFPAFADPARFPMVDHKTARWVTSHHFEQSRDRHNRLSPFKLNYTSLRYNEFDNYLNWVDWCREVAEVLTDKTEMQWRARDVEMAVWTAARQDLPLNPLP